MKREPFGTYIESTTLGEVVHAFVPPMLPPIPPLAFSMESQQSLDRTMFSLGRLDGAATTMPDADLLLYTFVRKDAVLSSQIEGTQSTLDELLLHEIDAVPGATGDGVREVSRYVDAIKHGLERTAAGFPLSSRLLREMHGLLLADGRGAAKQPGEFRRSQNWIGGTRPGKHRLCHHRPRIWMRVSPISNSICMNRRTPLSKRPLPMCNSKPFIRFSTAMDGSDGCSSR